MTQAEAPQQPEREELRIGVFICHCGLNIAGTLDIKGLVEYAKTLPDVAYVKDNRYTCADPGQEEIRKGRKDYKLNRVVVAALLDRAGFPPFMLHVPVMATGLFGARGANIREFSS